METENEHLFPFSDRTVFMRSRRQPVWICLAVSTLRWLNTWSNIKQAFSEIWWQFSAHLDPFVSQQQLVKDGPSRLFRTERIPFGQVQQLTVRFKEQETGIEENILLDLIWFFENTLSILNLYTYNLIWTVGAKTICQQQRHRPRVLRPRRSPREGGRVTWPISDAVTPDLALFPVRHRRMRLCVSAVLTI